MSFSHWDMNISNDGMAPDRIGVHSLDIICCTLCGICFMSIQKYLTSVAKTYTQNKLQILHLGPKCFRYLVFCEITVLGRSEKVIDSLLKVSIVISNR